MDCGQQIEKWFYEYGDDIYNYLIYFTGTMDVEDLVQEVFIKAMKSISLFRGASSPKTWLFAIARNTAVDYYRRQRSKVWLPYEFLDYLPSRDKSLDERLELDEEFKELYTAINSLKNNYREVLLLRGIKGFSPSETAHILNWSTPRVNSTLHRAIKSLKKQIHYNENGGIENA